MGETPQVFTSNSTPMSGRKKLKLAMAMTITVCVALFVLSYKHDEVVADHEMLAEQVATSAHHEERDPAPGPDHPNEHIETEGPFDENDEDPAMNTHNIKTKKNGATAALTAVAKHAKKVEECLEKKHACKNQCDPKDKKCIKACKPKTPCKEVALEVELLQEEGY